MIEYLAAVLAGAGIKKVDYIEDELGGKNLWKWPFAIIAGLAMGAVLSFSNVAILFLAIIAAQVLMGKVDKPAHGLAVGMAVVIPLVMGMNLNGMDLFLPFFFVAVLDEVQFAGFLKPMFEYRLWLKIAAFAVGAASGLWEYLLVLMCFDLAYLATERLMQKKAKPEKEKKEERGKKKK